MLSQRPSAGEEDMTDLTPNKPLSHKHQPWNKEKVIIFSLKLHSLKLIYCACALPNVGTRAH